MMNGARIVCASALAGLVAGCVSLNPTPSDDADLYLFEIDTVRQMVPQGPAFIQGLRAGYLDLLDAERGEFDIGDADHFARKAVESARGINVQPDMLELRTLDGEPRTELAAARARLIGAMEAEARQKAPLSAARAQVAFDCWLEEEEEGDLDGIEACRSSFDSAISETELGFASDINDVYIVYFAWDDAIISPIARSVLRQVAEDYARGDPARVVVAGHADLSGPAGYNFGLSELRAANVASELAAMGVDPEALEVAAFGETQPRVPTEDGVREPQNRRVEIVFEELGLGV